MTVEESKKNSRAKYNLRKQLQLAYAQSIKEGRAMIHANRETILVMQFNDDISFAVEFDDIFEGGSNAACVAFAFRRPSETPSYRVAKGILGQKLFIPNAK